MNRNSMIMVIMALCLLAGNAFGADWKYFGEFTTATEAENTLFYDSESITNTNGSIKLWVKIVLYDEIKKGLNNKLILDKATTKIASGYIAPITKISPKVMNAAYLEEAAGDSTTKSKDEILYQIVCDEKKYRTISQLSYNRDGVLDHRLGISKWENIVPDSNADNLGKLVCGSK